MIRFILIQNKAGKTRLSKWYVPFNGDEKIKIESEIQRAVCTRPRSCANFMEYRSYKLVYRQYAGLFFTFCVDINENELAIFELIQLLVETLDSYFGSVCELDLLFHFDKVYHVLDALILAGEISSTSKGAILNEVRLSDKLD